jgi:hypothetical protein
MRAVRSATVLLASALLLSACARSRSRPGRELSPADYFPLAVGNEWTWVDRSAGVAGGAPRRTVRITGRDPHGYFHDSERGELRADADCVHDRKRRLLCGPLRAGHSWASVVGVSSTERYEIAAVGEEVRTPAGTFANCVRVRAHNRAAPDVDHVLELSYAPGVGPVRLETWTIVAGEARPQVRAELESYKVQSR